MLCPPFLSWIRMACLKLKLAQKLNDKFLQQQKLKEQRIISMFSALTSPKVWIPMDAGSAM